ncbi:hypothetical protein INT47_011492 [Mucor saturninus]|uniref:Uncharacterized protein n=1 Tax=Mucor saturninus TaxID=64648 RepID=A0A8H7QPB2_9FUNG|nr:hypothetical protein INT47_011492 [Mucor saturninus]
MSTRKYHVTVEDCPDEDDIQYNQQVGSNEIDIDKVKCDQEPPSRGSKRQAWDNTEALEEQARSEKLQNQSTAMANATETARIVKEAQQTSEV